MIVAPIEGPEPPWRQHCWRLAGALLFTALEAAAEPESPTRVLLAFKAPEACADSVEFERRVKQRSDRIAFVSEAPYSGTANVMLEPSAGAVRVRLNWSREGVNATGREFKAASCSEALDAAALVIAISFDPSAPEDAPKLGDASSPEDDRAGGSPGSPSIDEPARASDASAPAAGSSTSPMAGSRPAAIRVTDAEAPERRAPDADASEASFAFGSSAVVQGLSGVAPVAMAGVGVSLELELGSGWLAPRVRLEGVHYFGVTHSTDGGDARFELDSLEAFACPLRLGSERVSLHPCAALSGGRLVASGRDTSDPASHTRSLWIAGGAVVLGLRPSPLLLVSAALGVGAPTRRDSFQFTPDEFHQISPVVVSGSVGLGVEFR